MDLRKTLNQYFYSMTINELRLMNERFQSLNITYNSLLYLDVISYTPNCTPSYLAKALNISKPAVAAKVGELIRQGLLIKTQSECDRRVWYLSVNEAVDRIYQVYDRAINRAIEVAEGNYSKEELEVFQKILSDIGKAYVGETQNE